MRATCMRDALPVRSNNPRTNQSRLSEQKVKIAVILENAPDCELERRVIDVPNDDDAINDAVSDVLEEWRYSVGDTIKIREVE